MRLFVFGLGYTAQVLARRLRGKGWSVDGTGRTGIAFTDDAGVLAAVERATHVLSSVPPDERGDPVLARYGGAIGQHGRRWVGYLSSTGVYGDTGGAWVDESAPLAGRRRNRIEADLAWRAMGAHVLRLPGIYGPGRSIFERLAEGRAHRIDLPDQVFSRIHVDDIASAIVASFDHRPQTWNIADDLPASQNAVIETACDLLRLPYPPLETLAAAALSPMARSFYAENRRVANGRARRVLGWRPAYPDFVAGLAALSAMTSPPSASSPPATDSRDHS